MNTAKLLTRTLLALIPVGLLLYLSLLFSNNPDMSVQQSLTSYDARMPDLPQDSVPAGPALFFPSLRRDGKIAQPTVIRGKFAYDAYCAFCHGPKGDGEGPVGQSFAPNVPALRASKLQAMNDETLTNAIFTGPGHYPVLARVVPPDDRPSLLLYVRGLNVGAAR